MVHNAAGFTLIEAMVVVAITAITLTLGVPTFGDALQRQRISTTMHLLSADMAMARSTALMRRAQVVVCPRTDTAACASGGDWSRGWLVFKDTDGNRRPDADSDLLRTTDAPAGSRDVLELSANRPLLRYQADGRSANTNLTVRICAGGQLRGKVIVNNLGRVRSERTSAGTPCSGG